MVRTDLILNPGQCAGVPAYRLLESAAHGFIGVDHAFLHAIVDDPGRAIPDLVRFAGEDRTADPLELDEVLLDIFRYLRTPEALPFFVQLARRDLLNIEDDLVKAFVDLGAASVDPLLQLFGELHGEDIGDVPFVLASLRVRDPRILEALRRLLEENAWDGAFQLEIYGDPAGIPLLEAKLAELPPEESSTHSFIESAIKILALGERPETIEAPEPFDIWDEYGETAGPEFEAIDEEALLAMLDLGSAELRVEVAGSFGREIPLKLRARLLEMAKTDADMAVRRASWEALGAISEEPEIRRAMLAVIASAESSIEERAGATVALAEQTDNAAVVQAIEDLYQDPRGRLSALKAMARSMDRRFAAYPPKHLDDPDPEIQGQAIWAVGYLNLSSETPRLEPFFRHRKLRTPALFAYALAVPGETSRGRAQALLKKVEEVAGELDAQETELVRIAIDQRLMLHGHRPVFFTDESEEEEDEAKPAASAKIGRNDPCPCGSGKKYKKCCGA